MRGSMTDDPTCPSCGVAYIDHLGLIGTCSRVIELEVEVRLLREELNQLNEEKNNDQ